MRPFHLLDAESMYKNWISDIAVQSEYGEPAYGDVDAVNELLQRWIGSYSRDDFYRWAVIQQEGGECIGQIAFCSVEGEHRMADIEYCIGRAFQRQGYASEALSAVITYTFAETGLHRLQAFHRGRNSASGGVLRKAGMSCEGVFRQSYYYQDTGEYDDRIYYGIVKGEPVEPKAKTNAVQGPAGSAP
ncbi:GNAT family N-acetyltransferase [Paenibacillus sp. MMS20-IR301]|uniref:GNAT family N-acetyltransferase n=1 Tax=Paenibacillus sp. MMS20-IR301 TaxID=2895946 RepID=UPI0028E2166C|nr:GNAT family N-acetyltransferase [Paenibacillus sp. MMS20-IR301]WNS45361.1 GNAT family N-acetyltransferase [Paenibacillus sp. MMS20-IR301]